MADGAPAHAGCADEAPVGRLSVTEPSDRVALSLSATSRRLRRLVETGAIARFNAELDAKVVDRPFDADVVEDGWPAPDEGVASKSERLAGRRHRGVIDVDEFETARRNLLDPGGRSSSGGPAGRLGEEDSDRSLQIEEAAVTGQQYVQGMEPCRIGLAGQVSRVLLPPAGSIDAWVNPGTDPVFQRIRSATWADPGWRTHVPRQLTPPTSPFQGP